MKKILIFIMSIAMILSVIPANFIFADENPENDSNAKGFYTQEEMGDPSYVPAVSKARAANYASSNFIVALDPGHRNAAGSGANGYVNEAVVNLKIAQYAKQELEANGVSVYMTRDGSKNTPAVPGSSKQDLAKTVEGAKNAGADVYVSLHNNSETSGNAYGAEVYYQNANYISSFNTESGSLAQKIQNNLVSLGLSNRGTKTRNMTWAEATAPPNPLPNNYYFGNSSYGVMDYYGVLRYSKQLVMPAVIVEHAFVSNYDDGQKLKSEAFLKQLGIADATAIIDQYELNRGTWVQDANGWKYKLNNGKFIADVFKYIDGYKYYFNSQGYRVTGFGYVGADRYYFDSEGRVLISSWKDIDSGRYYFTHTGAAARNVLGYVGADRYYFQSDGNILINSWKTIGSDTFYFGSNGIAKTGQYTEGDKKYFFKTDGTMLKDGWAEISGKKYYFMNTGVAAQSVLGYVGADMYYFQDDASILTNALKKIDGSNYYFQADGKVLKNSWKEVSSKKYYFTATGKAATKAGYVGADWCEFDSEGVLISIDKPAKGLKLENGKYYFYNDNGSLLKNSWKEVSGKKYYFMNTGVAAQSVLGYVGADMYYFQDDASILTNALKKIDGSNYYFQADGKVLKNSWKEVSGKKYYFTATGKAATKAGYVGADWCEFDSEGVLISIKKPPIGLTLENGKYYFYNDNGSLLKNSWKEVSGKKYYFMNTGVAAQSVLGYVGADMYYFQDDASILTNALKKIDGSNYYFQADGKVLKNSWKEVSSKKYYFTATGKAATKAGYVGADWCEFDSEGVLISIDKPAKGLKLENGKYYFYNDNGSLLKNSWKEVSGKKYYFMNTGVAAQSVLGYVGADRYFFQDDASVLTNAWKTIDEKEFYFDAGGKAPSEMLAYIRADRYYFAKEGYIVKDTWKDVSGNRYYLTSTGKAATGVGYVGAEQYDFGTDGAVVKYSIEGTSNTTAAKLAAYYRATSDKPYPVYYATAAGAEEAKTLEAFCDIYIQECAAEGIRAEVAFTQAMKETGWLKYGGAVKIGQFNFAGLGAVDSNPVAGSNTFSTVRIGIRAHIQHIKAYANTASLNNSLVDIRFNLVKPRGGAPYVEWLGQKENPSGKGWATSKDYGYSIRTMIKKLLTY